MQGKRTERVIVTCDGCKTSFEKLPKRVREENYCCRECKDKAGRKPRTEIACSSCGSIFHVAPWRAGKAKYCSDKCKFDGLSKTLDDRRSEFWSYVDIRGDDECWPWKSTTRSGYGRFWTGDGFVTAHVESWEQTYGRVKVVRGTKGVVLRHKCDNRICVNPSHLIPGTQSENAQDMVERGRSTLGQNIGETNASSKLTEDQVRAIRDDPRSQRVLAMTYGVSKPLIRYIKQRRIWKHVV